MQKQLEDMADYKITVLDDLRKSIDEIDGTHISMLDMLNSMPSRISENVRTHKLLKAEVQLEYVLEHFQDVQGGLEILQACKDAMET